MNTAFEQWWPTDKAFDDPYYRDTAERAWQAAKSHDRELMSCGHPRACLRYKPAIKDPDIPEGNCLVCEAAAQAREAALDAVWKAVYDQEYLDNGTVSVGGVRRIIDRLRGVK